MGSPQIKTPMHLCSTRHTHSYIPKHGPESSGPHLEMSFGCRHSWACTPLLGAIAPPNTCVPPSTFPLLVSWTQYHSLQFTDEESEARGGILKLENPHTGALAGTCFPRPCPLLCLCTRDPPGLTNSCFTSDHRSHQFNLGKGFTELVTCREGSAVGGNGEGGVERVLGCVGVEEGGENLIKTMSERRGRKRERERERGFHSQRNHYG